MQSGIALRPVVFLDRDGTLNIEAGYIKKLDDLLLIPGAGQSIKRLNDAGVAAILVTNQSGAARNFYPESHIRALHKRLQLLLAKHEAYLDAIYYCPHLPDGVNSTLGIVCGCRKPATGLIDLAYRELLNLNSSQSFVVGDKVSDVELGLNCQARSILVRTGYGNASLSALQDENVKPEFVAEDINEAVDWILQRI